MSDLLTAAQKADIHLRFDDIHDTFARDITIYVFEDTTFIDTDGSHNPLYGDPEGERERPPTTYTKKARIRYIGGEQPRFPNAGTEGQTNLTFPAGTIRLKVDSETYTLITKAKKIKVDDRLCELASAPARPGPFSPNYWSIYLKQVD